MKVFISTSSPIKSASYYKKRIEILEHTIARAKDEIAKAKELLKKATKSPLKASKSRTKAQKTSKK